MINLQHNEWLGDPKTGWQFIKIVPEAEAPSVGRTGGPYAMFGGPGCLESIRVIPLADLDRDTTGALILRGNVP